MKLHLGCGQRYFHGYTNVDFPIDLHTVQGKSVADFHADILALKYPSNSVEEIRLHHVFEHFTRPIACALLASWHSWLKPDGIIHLEVPDFEKTARVVLGRFSSNSKKCVAMRHLFGSHEADWAVHREGYTPGSMSVLLQTYGYEITKVMKNKWKGTYNFEIIGKKIAVDTKDKEDFKAITETYLTNFLVHESESALLLVWLEMYSDQIAKSWADNG